MELEIGSRVCSVSQLGIRGEPHCASIQKEGAVGCAVLGQNCRAISKEPDGIAEFSQRQVACGIIENRCIHVDCPVAVGEKRVIMTSGEEDASIGSGISKSEQHLGSAAGDCKRLAGAGRIDFEGSKIEFLPMRQSDIAICQIMIEVARRQIGAI